MIGDISTKLVQKGLCERIFDQKNIPVKQKFPEISPFLQRFFFYIYRNVLFREWLLKGFSLKEKVDS